MPKGPKKLQSQLFCNRCKRQCHLKERERHLLSQILPLLSKGALLKQVSLEFEKKVKKLVSVLVTITPLTKIREKIVKTIEIDKTAKAVETIEAVETIGVGKNGKESEDKYPENLT